MGQLSQSIAATLFYVVVLLVPGYLMCWASRLKRNVFALAFGVSFSVAVLTQVVTRILGGSLRDWVWLYVGVVLCLVLSTLYLRHIREGRSRTIRTQSATLQKTSIGLIAIVFVFSIYHVICGAYTEIPSDFWARLGHVSDQVALIKSGNLQNAQSISHILDDSVYVPFLHGVIAETLNLLPINAVTEATLVTSLVFIIAIYYFSLKILATIRISTTRKVIVSCLAVLFSVIAFGISSFSYVRYYAYFPHILNMALMYATLTVVIDQLQRSKIEYPLIILSIIFFLVMAIVNAQEALFLLVMVATLLVWRGYKACLTSSQDNEDERRRKVIIGVVTIAFVGIGVGVVLIHSEPGPLGEPHLINLGSWNSVLMGWPIVNPSMRFWDVLGFFGLVTYAWFLIRWGWFERLDYVNAAMLTPLVTLFNPIFVYWFIHVASWDPIWRLAFLMPIPFVSAYLIVRSWSGRLSDRWTAGRVIDRALSVGLVLLVFPVQFGPIQNEMSRLPSMTEASRENGALLWSDLIYFLDNLDGQQEFVTDSVTNYVLQTATRHVGPKSPKERWQKGENTFAGDYKDRLLYYRLDDKILIINTRNGRHSLTGEVSGHWPADILNVSETYPSDLRQFVDDSVKDFKLLWENDGISVYRILRDPKDYE